MSKEKERYDYVYLTNTPSFYKLNLCDALGRDGVKGLLVFYGYGSEAVNTTLERGVSRWHFDYRFLDDGDSNRRGFWRTFEALRRLMKAIETDCIIYSGWLANEYNLWAFLSRRRKNVVVVESTPWESSIKGIKGWIKRRIVGRMSGALPSGKPHRELLSLLGYRGEIEETGSVGIFYQPERKIETRDIAAGNGIDKNKRDVKYLYVGRLIDCKNLEFLIEQFNRSGRSLTIVGKGDLEDRLKEIAGEDISFVGFVDNNRLPEIYKAHDVFVLPSKSETWGMVVEEAIYWGLPVIVSDRVGSGKDMVEAHGTGVVFKLGDVEDFETKCEEIEENYANFANQCADVDFDARRQAQINAFKKIIQSDKRRK